MSRLALALGLSLAGVGLLGCKAKGEAVTPDEGVKLPIVVRASADSNDGRPVYVVVRIVDEQGFIEDSYAKVAALVVEPDESVLATLLVFPGTVAYRELELEAAPEMLGVYGLFSVVEDGNWKLLVEGQAAVELAVGADAIALRAADERR